MTGVAVYLEGGGDKAEGKAFLRTGMGEFLGALRDLARARGLRWRVVTCGSRNDAFAAFMNAVATDPELYSVLLVDSECAVESEPASHLREHDGWAIPNDLATRVHLMAQVMETWLVADAAALQRFYGQGFASNALPRTTNLETVGKQDIYRALEAATERTQAGRFHKIRHASKLLELVEPSVVRQRCAHCDAMFVTVESALR